MAYGKTDLSLDAPDSIARPRTRHIGHIAGTLGLLAATLAVSGLTADRKSEPLARPLTSIPRAMAGFTASDEPALDAETLAQLKPTSYLSRAYNRPGLRADLFIAFYSQQRAGESMHSPRHCLPGSGWEIWDYGKTTVRAANREYGVNKYSISKDRERLLVLYWYQSRDRIIASEYLGKVLLARDALMQNSTAGSIVRIIVPDRPGSLEAARELAAQVIPAMQHCIER